MDETPKDDKHAKSPASLVEEEEEDINSVNLDPKLLKKEAGAAATNFLVPVMLLSAAVNTAVSFAANHLVAWGAKKIMGAMNDEKEETGAMNDEKEETKDEPRPKPATKE